MEGSLYDYIGVLDTSDAAEDAAGGKSIKIHTEVCKRAAGMEYFSWPLLASTGFFFVQGIWEKRSIMHNNPIRIFSPHVIFCLKRLRYSLGGRPVFFLKRVAK